ncbi:MAG: hypothetical protein IPJ69_14245 [Deltaproteobacteria bacterium]|nr:MAG: hypothetical protein IPJ69_14245 [Deltaproteobacteria bacterium]
MRHNKFSHTLMMACAVASLSLMIAQSIHAEEKAQEMGKDRAYIYTQLLSGDSGSQKIMIEPIDPKEAFYSVDLPASAQIVGVVSGVVAIDPVSHALYIINSLDSENLLMKRDLPLGIDPSPLGESVNPAASGVDPTPLDKVNPAASGVDPTPLDDVNPAASGVDPTPLDEVNPAASGVDPTPLTQ